MVLALTRTRSTEPCGLHISNFCLLEKYCREDISVLRPNEGIKMLVRKPDPTITAHHCCCMARHVRRLTTRHWRLHRSRSAACPGDPCLSSTRFTRRRHGRRRSRCRRYEYCPFNFFAIFFQLGCLTIHLRRFRNPFF